MPALRLEDPIDAVPGVGPARGAVLQGARIRTVEDLLLYLPLRYEDRSRVLPVADLQEGEPATVQVTVTSCRRSPVRNRRARVQAQVRDDSGPLTVVWFNQAYLADQLRAGTTVLLYGRPSRYKERLQLVNPVHASIDVDSGGPRLESEQIGPAVPIYRRIGTLGSGAIRRLVRSALDCLAPDQERLPARVIRSHDLMAMRPALQSVYRPPAEASLIEYDERRSAAHRRLILQEFIDFQAALALQRQGVTVPGRARQITSDRMRRIRGSLPFALTAAQERALRVILADIATPRAMHRLLQGDVGCGKTAVAACALLAIALDGVQGALLAPTEILARQQAQSLGGWAGELGVEVELLVGGMPAASRRRALARIESGAVGIAVGTHALLQSGVTFADLSLVVVDEQHRFGVRQRAALRDKGLQRGLQPDLLVMTATPIPRSLALTVYGDLAVTAIDALPPGRTPVETTVRGAREWPAIRSAIRDHAAAGQQVFVVSPRIDADPDDDVRAAVPLHAELVAQLPDLEIGLLHGGLDAVEKAATMGRFVDGRTAVLVATTVIEVGVDVPAATLMIIEHAERFGLAQLHQLRGRVGRGERPGICWLVAHEPMSATARTRLRTLCETTDGFVIAERDLRLRGPGEVLGTRQAGAFGLRLGDPFAHPDWLLLARDIATELVDAEDAESEGYRRQLRQTWKRRLRLVRAG